MNELDMFKRLLVFSLKYDGNFENICKALEFKEDIGDFEERVYVNALDTFMNINPEIHNMAIITAISDTYPEIFKKLKNPPIVLFAMGEPRLFTNSTQVAVLDDGTRCFMDFEITKKGIEFAVATENILKLKDELNNARKLLTGAVKYAQGKGGI